MILGLVGPTASGKTRIALGLAPQIAAEVLSVDSMQVYRGMDVGTAKPSPMEQTRVKHHLLDLADPGERFSVAEFQSAARMAMAQVRERGCTPLLVGGSGLYFRAVADDLAFPPTDATVRADLEREDLAVLRDRLAAIDPDASARIQPANKRRIVRALEVIEITGRPFSSFRTSWDAFATGGLRVAGLRVAPGVLRARITERTLAMFAGPLQDETTGLVEGGYRAALSAAAAIGYSDALAVIEGRSSVDDAVERTVRATIDLARRQMRWFKRDPRIHWIDADELEGATAEVQAYWSERTTAAAGGA